MLRSSKCGEERKRNVKKTTILRINDYLQTLTYICSCVFICLSTYFLFQVSDFLVTLMTRNLQRVS